jgi:F-type H+-transporting ATPase subunit a
MLFEQIEHMTGLAWFIQAALVAGGLLLFAGLLVRRKLAVQGGGVVPDEGVTLRNLMEVLVEWLANVSRERMGADWRRYFPIVGTIFFFILLSNLMGLIPGLAGATSNANTTWAWAVIAWVVYTAVGIAKHKQKYLMKFMGPPFGKHHIHWMAPIFLILELPLDIARIMTLAVRLLANMFADHAVVLVWISLVPIGIPAIFMGLGLVVCILQAFVFSLLTMIYIGLALEEPH